MDARLLADDVWDAAALADIDALELQAISSGVITSTAIRYGGAQLVTHGRGGKPLAKPRPPTRREKAAATRGAKHLNSSETHAALSAPAPTAAEAAAQALAEGLTLVRSSTHTGYKNVTLNGGVKPYQSRKGKKHLGCFVTAEEAALAYARFLGPCLSKAEATAAADTTASAGGKAKRARA